MLFRSDSDMINLTVDLDLLITDTGLAHKAFERHYSVDKEIFTEYSSGRLVSVYDYEYEINENKKFIRVIKSMYYAGIMNEFRVLTGHNAVQFATGM